MCQNHNVDDRTFLPFKLTACIALVLGGLAVIGVTAGWPVAAGLAMIDVGRRHGYRAARRAGLIPPRD